MSSDFSRQRFNPANDFSSVLMQQGRVQLDADWNEWNEILDRRWRSETIDIMGRGVVPLETPHGFEILLSGGGLTIGRGRIYVDGLQAENHGAGNLEFDPVLAESRGIDPIPYDKQLYFPNAPALPEAGGPHLVFLDVWEREVTYVEDPDLVENAVGVDTTSRLQTAWQVRVLPNVGDNATCGTPDEQLAGWLDIIRPSAGRLTTKAVGVATPDDPCLIPPSGGYRGLENRLYRVEIHDGGIVGKATFKWSRDNASVATGVNRIEGNLTLTVDRAVWDSVRRFSPGDWVEITDDWQEFSGAPGEIRRIASVVDADRTITLDAALTNGLFPVDGQNLTAPERHTRIKRWDQTGIVRDSNGNTYVDLDSAGSTGLIKVPDAGTSLILEDGVEVTFTTASNDGVFRSDDYWVFVARTADASVEELKAAPPRGVHHHYCRLALVTFPEQVLDCRTFWPPSFGGEAKSCDCTICITAEQHNQGTLTIQQAVNQLLKTGGTVCLGPGIFNLMEKPVQLTGAFAVRIRGQGAATILIQPRANPAFIINQAQWCTIDYLTIHTIAAATIAPAIQLTNSVGATIERLIIAPPAEGNGPLAGISLEAGFLLVTRIRDNFIRAQSGVIFPLKAGDDSGALLLGSFDCERNTMQCSDTGIRLDGSSFYTSDTVLARNFIFGTTVAGISATGFAFPELEINGNTLTPQKGDGIVVGTGGVRISENRIINLNVDTQNGIRLVHGLVALAVAPIVVKGNRLQGLRGDGLSIETALISAVVQNNVFNAVEGTGLIMQPGSAAGSLKVLANELINIAVASATSDKTTEIAAIYLRGVFEGAVSDNAISAVGINSPIAGVIAGVRIDNSIDVRVSDNSITNIAPASQFSKPAAGILVVGPIANIEIADNLIKRQIQAKDIDDSPWQAIRIAGTTNDTKLNSFIALDTQSSLGKINTVSVLAAASAPGKEQVGIIGNSIHGYGRSALAEVVVSGSCRFSDNYCSEVAERVETAVTLAADSIIASANRVECAHNTKALNLTVPDKNVFTVLGNIVGGPIVVNNGALPAPWQPLNIVAP
jgi:Family of unknown function (DUF6519)